MQSNTAKILQKVKSYSPDMQREIFDFIEFIENKYKLKLPVPKKKTSLREEPFVGMWKNRKEMENSVEYVKNLRRKQSLRNHS